MKFARHELLVRLSLLWQRDHTIICGAGWRGVPLAKSFLKQNAAVIVVDRDATSEGVHQCRDLGIPVVIGDATDPSLLRSLRVQHASTVVAVCAEDGA